jgi:periplasmic protein TonB
MAYADQRMSSNRIAAIVIVALLHALLGYAFITGLAYNVVKQVARDLKTFDVTEEPPPPEEEPPPPPPEQVNEPPPVVTPPPIVRTAPPVSAPIIQTAPVAPPVVITPTAPPAPPPPPPAPKKVEAARAKGNLLSLLSDEDYPSSALRNEEQGTTAVRLEIGPNGRVTGCTVTSSSGSASLDDTTCKLLSRRARFTPARDDTGQPTNDTYTQRVTWRLPD